MFIEMMRRAALLATLVLLAVPPQAQAQTREKAAPPAPVIQTGQVTERDVVAAIRRDMEGLVRDEARFRSVLTVAWGPELKGEKYDFTAMRIKALLLDERLQRRMGKVLLPIVQAGRPAPGLVRDASMTTVRQLQLAGMKRLPPDRQAAMLGSIVATMMKFPPETCKAMALGTMSTRDQITAERDVVVRLPVEEFKTVIDTYIDAALAELAQYPDERVLSAEQVQEMEQIYAATLMAEVKRRDLMALFKTFHEDRASLAASDVCLVSSIGISSMLEMPEPYRTWQLFRFMKAME